MFLLTGPAPPLPPELWQATQDESLYTGPSPSPPWPRVIGHPFPVEELVTRCHCVRFLRLGVSPGHAASDRLAHRDAQTEPPQLAAKARHRACHPHRESLRRMSNRLFWK